MGNVFLDILSDLLQTLGADTSSEAESSILADLGGGSDFVLEEDSFSGSDEQVIAEVHGLTLEVVGHLIALRIVIPPDKSLTCMLVGENSLSSKLGHQGESSEPLDNSIEGISVLLLHFLKIKLIIQLSHSS
jgi:hypothetical protein